MLDQAQAQHNDMLRKRRILMQDKEKMGLCPPLSTLPLHSFSHSSHLFPIIPAPQYILLLVLFACVLL